MNRRHLGWLLAVLSAAAAALLLIPGSPFYLPDRLTPGTFHGRRSSEWARQLKDPDPIRRAEACRALGSIGLDAAGAVPVLAGLLRNDPERVVRGEAAMALSKMTPASKAAAPQLGEALSDTEPVVRMNAAMALSRLGADGRPAVPTLIAALADDANDDNLDSFTFTIRDAAALALGRATAGTADGVPALTAALAAAKTDRSRRAVTRALGEVGRPAAPAVPQIRPFLKSADADLREAADWALSQIEPDGPN